MTASVVTGFRTRTTNANNNRTRATSSWLLLVACACMACVVEGKVQYAGVSLSGAEFGQNVPGSFNSDYTYPTTSEVDYFVAKGMNIFRIPFLWERLQTAQFATFNAQELQRLTTIINYITVTKGKFALLDPHNYARYYGQVIGQSGSNVPKAAFNDFWTKLANQFKSNSKVMFGLMNEPNSMDTNLWRDTAQGAINAIRVTGATNLITVPGNAWTGAWSWTSSYYGTPNSVAMATITDPINNFVFEVHQYLDSDSSGQNANCVGPTIGSQRLRDFTSWCRQNGKRALLGEVGAGSGDDCLPAIDDMLTYMDVNNDVWMGWTWWSAGPWWGNYFMSIEPSSGRDARHLVSIARHLPPTGPNSNIPSTTGAVLPPSSTTGSPRPPICPGNNNGDNGIPITSDSVAFSQAPFVVTTTGVFTVVVAYSSQSSRVIVVDVLSSGVSPSWYGKGTVSVGAGKGTVSIQVTLQTAPRVGPNYVLHAWIVDANDFKNKADPWNFALGTSDRQVSVGGSASVFSQSVEACTDTQPCVEVCGNMDNVSTCDCDSAGHVTVVCADTPQAGDQEVSTANSNFSNFVASLLLAGLLPILVGLML